MSTVRPNEKSITSRRHKISELKAKRTKINSLASCKESQFWQDLKSLLSESISNQEYVIENGLSGEVENIDLTYAGMARAYGCKLQAQALIDIVENPGDHLERIDNAIKAFEEQIKEMEPDVILESRGV